MCKININIPTLPENCSVTERRRIFFRSLSSLDLSEYVEKRDGLSYVSWSNAWRIFCEFYPNAKFEVVKNEQGLPYFVDPLIGVMVFVKVEAEEGYTQEMYLPVLDNKNKTMKLEEYTYQVYDSYNRKYVEKKVNAVSMFDINRALQRALVKCISLFGLGLYLYQGQDLQEAIEDETEGNDIKTKSAPSISASKRTSTRKRTTDKYAGIKTALNTCTDQVALMNLYMQHKNEVDSNTEIRDLFTERKLELQNAA